MISRSFSIADISAMVYFKRTSPWTTAPEGCGQAIWRSATGPGGETLWSPPRSRLIPLYERSSPGATGVRAQSPCAKASAHDVPIVPWCSLRRGLTLVVVENGHSYPPESAWLFGEQPDHPATQHEVVDELRRRYATDWPTIWGIVWSHREACLVACLRALDAALSEPKATRQGIRRRMLAALAAIAARGPEAIPLRTRQD